MAPRIFITGITGYIGGDALYAVHQAHPDFEFAALIRSKDKADQVRQQCPSVEPIIGSLDDYQIIKEQAAKADIVIHTADSSDHAQSAKAIAEGLLEGHSKDKPGFWLHTSGTGILCWEDIKYMRLGEESDKVYDDWEGVKELTNLPDEAMHRDVDKLVLAAAAQHGDVVKTAILCPPTIYGKGRGPSNSRSRQAYDLAKVILEEKYVPLIGKGKARWNQLHVNDLSQLFLLLVDAAVQKRLDPGLWGSDAYYIVENGDLVWGEFARQMGEKAAELGFIPKPESKVLSKDEAIAVAQLQSLTWGLNSRAKAERARKLLNWQPNKPPIEEEISTILKEEHERLNKK